MSKITKMMRKVRFEKFPLGLSMDADNLGGNIKRNVKIGTKCFLNNDTILKSNTIYCFRDQGFCQGDNL